MTVIIKGSKVIAATVETTGNIDVSGDIITAGSIDAATIETTGNIIAGGDVEATGNLQAATATIGGESNYTEVESDGTIKHVGTATVYNDINTGINPRNTGAGRPTLSSFVGNLQEFKFAINDFADVTPIEFLHGWKEGSQIEFHCHWATGGVNDATVRGVKWEIEYTWANISGGGSPEEMSSTTVISAETSIASGQAAKTHKYTSVGTLTPAGGKIGAQLCFRIKRIASVTNTAPTDDPFLLSIGIHYEIDTAGSRTTSSK
jgi:hypothetical protein